MLTFNFHIGDFAKKTMHLTHEERGIYLQMLVRYYDTEEPLPADVDQVCRLVCVRNADAKRLVSDLLAEFFELQDDGWHNERADKEIEKYQNKSKKARESAEARWNAGSKKADPKKSQSERNTDAKPSDTDRNANASEAHSEGNANHEPQTTNHINTPHSPPEGELELTPTEHDPKEHIEFAFERFWCAGLRKIDKQKARKAFGKKCGKDPEAFADRLIADIQRRFQLQELGINNLHPTTYLNNERWEADYPQPESSVVPMGRQPQRDQVRQNLRDIGNTDW